MAPKKRASAKATKDTSDNGAPPVPFKRPAEVLQPFIDNLNPKHIYITHIDSHPVSFKQRIFLVPVAMNIAVAGLFVLRMYSILPWYWQLLMSGLGHDNETTFAMGDSTWDQVGWEIGRRTLTFAIDFMLMVFVWPWPLEFVAGMTTGNPCKWRLSVGFRQKEIYVRRSREWDTLLKDIFKDDGSNRIVTAYINQATSPTLQEQKTGYLLMNGHWDLDWNAMIHAHRLVDKKEIALDAFKNVALVYNKAYGWLSYDLKMGVSAAEDEKRRQVFAFRDALTSLGQEKLFYRWVEIVQFEASQPGGFGPEKQEVAAKKIREMFEKEGIDFDELWKETMGTSNPTEL